MHDSNAFLAVTMTITYNELTLLGPKCPRVVVVRGWFNAATMRIILVPSVCGYSPVMYYLPSTPCNIHSLKRSVQMSRKQGLEEIKILYGNTEGIGDGNAVVATGA